MSGMTNVKTDSIGNSLGARNGSIYAMKVNTVNTILRKNINLLNPERFFMCYVYTKAN